MSQQYPHQAPPPPGYSPQPPPKPFNWGKWALWTALAAAVAFGGIGALAHTLNGDSSSANPVACKAAMQKQFDRAMAAGSNAPQDKRPHECDGVDDKTVQRYATEILQKELGKQ